MATYSSFQEDTGSLEYKKLNFGSLYLYHTQFGPKANQEDIIAPKNGLGRTIANNWEVYDGVGPGSKLVARAQGLHIEAGNWHNSFSLVFEDGRFKDSSFELMGIHSMWEWAIVGGTGDLAMATGVVKKVTYESNADGNILELTVRAFCPVFNESTVTESPALKIGPCGGPGGYAQDIEEGPKRLESITVRSGVVVDSIEFSYIDHAGRRRSAGPWGGHRGNPHTIHLDADEFVTEMAGTIDKFDINNDTVITSLKIVTNLQTFGPWGDENGAPFTIPVQSGSGIVGFFGRSGVYLDAIGVYVSPI
ncbi:jacalin-related lectin 3-like [Panicum virgatum]|uniref:Dirigent protein n=1 Tax=Panicum virgatum TaxID=38727 RepID=A0A8T0W866_PANVG|nr:jacalin-related lectin 3-like [Panicum virgatum]KAG2640833.1 hypothetical protein PVAP13_2KG121700 [Panicum virgatum]